MRNGQGASQRWVGWLVAVLIFGGIALRLNRYLCGFPFWGDEAWVAQEIDRSFRDILFNTNRVSSLPLPPVGFLLLERWLVGVFDLREMVFRSFPCLCGVWSVLLFKKLLQETLGQRVMLIGLAFFVLSNLLIFYSSELKPYSSDVFFLLLMYWLHGQAVRQAMSGRNVVLLMGVGLLGVFIAPLSLLVFGGVAALQIIFYARRRTREPMRRYGLVLGVWCWALVATWWIYYRVSYSPQIMGYYNDYYLFFPLANGDWAALGRRLFSVFRNPVELTWPWLAAAMFWIGAWSLWRRARQWFALLVSPLILIIGLSLMNKYPFHGRFLVFLAPIFLIFIAQGVDDVMGDRPWRRVVGGLILAILLFQPVANAQKYIVPASMSDVRSLMLYIRAHQQPGDGIYFNNESRWGAGFYYDVFSFPHDLTLNGILDEQYALAADAAGRYFVIRGPDGQGWKKVYGGGRVVDERGRPARLSDKGRAWILFSQLPAEKERMLIQWFDAFGRKLDEQRSHNAALYLYDLK